MKNIMFIAPPAGGKGTFAELVEKKYNIPHISTGDILRQISNEDSEIGNYVKDTLAKGGLVKDEITYKLVEERLSQDDCKNGFIIEGFPRNINQAKEYEKILDHLKIKMGKIILINIKEETLEKRIVGRRVCEKCKRVYNLNDPAKVPVEETKCDYCGGKLYQRTDDNIEAFKNRYNTYLEKTTPIIEYYKSKYDLNEVNGNASLEEVFNEIDKVIKK